MNGITIHKDTEGQVCEVRYLTDDRDARAGRRLELCIGWGNNGDWYVVTVPEGERSISAVRLCTSGGASSVVPGFVPLIAEAFRKLAVAGGAKVEPFQSAITPDIPPTEARQCVKAGAEASFRDEAFRLLTECCYVINMLADQQAMPDDFYKKTLEGVGRFFASPAPSTVSECTWTYDPDGYWATSCGDQFCITEGSPAENRMRYCHYCSGRIVTDMKVGVVDSGK